MELPVTLEQYNKISNLIDYYWSHRNEYSYNFIGILSMLAIGKGIAPKNSFFCSQWVATVLQEAGVNLFADKEPKDVRPFDFYGALEDKIIYEGSVVKYPYYKDLECDEYVKNNKVLVKNKNYSLINRGYDEYARTKNT